MKLTSYFLFAFLFSTVIYFSGCNNENVTTPTASTNSKTSGSLEAGDNIKKPSGGGLIDGCSGCTVTYHCEYVGTSTPFVGAYVDVIQGGVVVLNAGVTDTSGNVTVLVGSISPGSSTVFAHSPNSPTYNYTGTTNYTHSQQSTYQIDVDMYEIDK